MIFGRFGTFLTGGQSASIISLCPVLVSAASMQRILHWLTHGSAVTCCASLLLCCVGFVGAYVAQNYSIPNVGDLAQTAIRRAKEIEMEYNKNEGKQIQSNVATQANAAANLVSTLKH